MYSNKFIVHQHKPYQLHKLATILEWKMKTGILGSASPAKTLQNELCLMKVGQSYHKLQSFDNTLPHTVKHATTFPWSESTCGHHQFQVSI